MLNVCVAGVTGTTGSAVAQAITDASDLALTAGTSRRAAGQDLGTTLGGAANGISIQAHVAQALDGVDVLVDYTSPNAVLGHVLTAIRRGVHVVVGTSGLTLADYSVIDRAAREQGVGVIGAGNFSITAALVKAACVMAAEHLPDWEIIDFAHDGKPDAPSGTARELADSLTAVTAPGPLAAADTAGAPAAPTEQAPASARVHSLRLPSYGLSTEVIFGLPDERLIIRHDGGTSPGQYVRGTLMAIRAVGGQPGVRRGIESLLLRGQRR